MTKSRKLNHLVSNEIQKNNFKKKKTNKKLRRIIKRISLRKNITYKQAILDFYKVKSFYELDKNLIYSLYKDIKKEKIHIDSSWVF